jgi:hypothetical protein
MDILTYKKAKDAYNHLFASPVSEIDSYHRGMTVNNQIFTLRLAVSIHFDDGYSEDYTVVYPALLERHLVGGFAIVEDYIDQVNRLTFDQILEMQTNGMEVMHHTKSHIDSEVGLSISDFVEQTYNSVNRLRAKGLNMQSLVMPGTARGDMFLDTEAKLNNIYAQILRKTYRVAHGFILPDGSGISSLPVSHPVGFGSGYTIETLTLTDLTNAINAAIRIGGTLSFTCHAWKLGTASYLSVADFESFLDYLVTKQTAGP